MKKKIIIGVAFMLMSLQQLAAQDSIQVRTSVSRNFEESFEGAKYIQWKSLPKKVTQAQFHYQGRSWIAYYDTNGNLITSGRLIKTIDDLPLQVQTGLRRAKARVEKKSGAFQVSVIFEMLQNETTKYYITMQNGDSFATISVHTNGIAVLESKNARTPEPRTSKDVIARKN